MKSALNFQLDSNNTATTATHMKFGMDVTNIPTSSV